MGQTRLRVAAVLLGLLCSFMASLAAPVVFNILAQPDSAAAVPGGYLTVHVGPRPFDAGYTEYQHAGWNVTVEAVDGSWRHDCVTDALGLCTFTLDGTKGTVTVANATRAFFIPQGYDATWNVMPGQEDDGTPLGLGPGDAVLPVLFALGTLGGMVASVALWRRRAPLLAFIGVGFAGVMLLLHGILPGVAVAGFAGYALVKDSHLFGAVPLNDADVGEEEE